MLPQEVLKNRTKKEQVSFIGQIQKLAMKIPIPPYSVFKNVEEDTVARHFFFFLILRRMGKNKA